VRYLNVYGVATISRLLKIIGLFCKRALQKRPIFFKETYNFKEPTNRSHPIYQVLTLRALESNPHLSMKCVHKYERVKSAVMCTHINVLCLRISTRHVCSDIYTYQWGVCTNMNESRLESCPHELMRGVHKYERDMSATMSSHINQVYSQIWTRHVWSHIHTY